MGPSFAPTQTYWGEFSQPKLAKLGTQTFTPTQAENLDLDQYWFVLVLGGYLHFNIPIGYWYESFFNTDIGLKHEFSNPFEMDISQGVDIKTYMFWGDPKNEHKQTITSTSYSQYEICIWISNILIET